MRIWLIILTSLALNNHAEAYDAKEAKEHLKAMARLSTEQYPGGPTLGKCLAAISDAQQHNNEWQANFSMQECRDIAQKSFDNGMLLLNDAAE